MPGSFSSATPRRRLHTVCSGHANPKSVSILIADVQVGLSGQSFQLTTTVLLGFLDPKRARPQTSRTPTVLQHACSFEFSRAGAGASLHPRYLIWTGRGGRGREGEGEGPYMNQLVFKMPSDCLVCKARQAWSTSSPAPNASGLSSVKHHIKDHPLCNAPCFPGRVKRFFRSVLALADKPKELKKQVREGLPAPQAVEPMRVSIEGVSGFKGQNRAGIESERSAPHLQEHHPSLWLTMARGLCSPEFVQGRDHLPKGWL